MRMADLPVWQSQADAASLHLVPISADAFRTRRAERILLLVILLIALGLRLTWVLMQPSDPQSLQQLPDQTEYLSLAKSLLAGHGLRLSDARFGQQTVYAYRMPGYPAFLRYCQAQPVVARVVQAVLDTSTVLAVWLLTRMLLSRDKGRLAAPLAAAIVAVNPFLIFFSALLLSDTVYTAVLIWGVVLMLAGARGGSFSAEPGMGDDVEPASFDLHPPRPRPWLGTLLWLIGGAVLAGSVLIRPSAIGLGVLLGVVIAIASLPLDRSLPAFRLRWPLPPATTMLLLTAAALFPWAYRNSQVLGEWVWTTTNAGVTAYDGWNPDATGGSDQSVLLALPQIKTMTETERSAYLAERAAAWAKEDWQRTLTLAVMKAARTWSPLPLSAEYGSWKNSLAGLVYAVPLDLLALLGLFRGPMRRSAKLLLLSPAVYYTLVHMATVGSLRYRLPVEPFLAILAAVGILALRMDRPVWRRAT